MPKPCMIIWLISLCHVTKNINVYPRYNNMFRRRLYRKKPAVRRRRPARRGIRRIPRGIPGVYRFKRLANLVRIYHQVGDAATTWRLDDTSTILNASTVTLPSGSIWPGDNLAGTAQNQFTAVHRLNQAMQSGDFTNLYDQYKITGVKATFLYQVSDSGATGASVLPTIMWSPDYDDIVAPTYPELRSKQNVKQRILTANAPFSVFYRPKTLTNVQSSNGALVPNAMLTRGFLDSAYPAVDHCGLRFSLNNMYGSTGTSAQLEIKFTYYLAFKNPQ